MGSRIAAIADALVAAYLSGYAAIPQRVSQNIDCTRTWYTVTKQAVGNFPIFDHSNIVAHSVQVFVMALAEKEGDCIPGGKQRDRIAIEYPIQVGIAAHLKTNTPADTDPLIQLSEELRDYPLKQSPAYSLGIPERPTSTPEVISNPDFDALQTDKLFLAVFQFAFKGTRLL